MREEADRSPGHDVIVTKGPCPKCGSRDNLVHYADGHAHCFSPGCGYYLKEGGIEPGKKSKSSSTSLGDHPPPSSSTPSDLLPPGASVDLAKRRISAATCSRFGYYPATFNGKRVMVGQARNQEGEVACQKLRFKDKGEGFPTLGKGLGECQLFGQHLWGGKDRVVVITEGYEDAMAVAEATSFKTPAVSVNTGAAGAAKNLKANLLWLMKFEKVVLFFDNDEAGREAVAECVKLFPVGKVFVAKLPNPKDKDACDALKAKRPGDITAAVWGAEPYSPPGIINGKALLDRIDFDAPPPKRAALPWPILTEKLYGGIAEKEVVFLLSGAGKGKTTFQFEVISCWLDQGLKIGAFFFEDDQEDVLNGLLTTRLSKRLRLDPSLVSGADKRAEWLKITSNDQLFLFDGEAAKWDLESLVDYIRYLAKSCNVDVVLIDPFSFVIAQSSLTDERRGIDEVLTILASLAKQLNVRIVISHHLTRPEGNRGHEEGADIMLKQARGSNGIGMFATLVLGLRWMPEERVTAVKCLKSRKQGELNDTVLTWLSYIPETGRVIEIAEPVNLEDTARSRGEAPLPAPFREEF